MSYRLEQTNSVKTFDVYIENREGKSDTMILDGEIRKIGSGPAYYETASHHSEILTLQDIEDIAKALKEVDNIK